MVVVFESETVETEASIILGLALDHHIVVNILMSLLNSSQKKALLTLVDDAIYDNRNCF